MRAGPLRHRLTVERRSTTKDSVGGMVDTWTTLLTCRCEFQPVSGREFIGGGAMQSEAQARFIIRYDSSTAAITSADRILYNGGYYNIIHTANSGGRNQMLELVCSENDRGQS